MNAGVAESVVAAEFNVSVPLPTFLTLPAGVVPEAAMTPEMVESFPKVSIVRYVPFVWMLTLRVEVTAAQLQRDVVGRQYWRGSAV